MAAKKDTKGDRELVQPHEKRYQRRIDDGTFGKSDDQSKSLSRDVKQHAKTKRAAQSGRQGGLTSP